MAVAQKEQINLSKDHLATLYDLMLQHDDTINAEKIIDLYEKIDQAQFNISFSGHFSAGKSSLINYILEKEVLPKSPIPTSANIVKITSGEGVARVFFNEAQPVQYREPYDIDMIKDFATDKDTIKRIEINTLDPILPAHCALLDTPGIDAADDADRLMTESALHLVDVLYYVMDYNHVQSEVNMYFLQKMQKEQVPFYIIINQIDKHNEREIPFEAFNKSIKQTFDQWQIYPEDIYYCSVLYPDAAHNELEAIKTDLFSLLNRNNVRGERTLAAVKEIVHAHKQFLQEENNEILESLAESKLSETDAERLYALNEKMTYIDQLKQKLKLLYDEEVKQTLKNAYLMPAKLRDLAKSYLESKQKDFKVGFFQAKKKTQAEQTKRLETFLQALQQSVEATIQWKLHDKFNEILTEHDVRSETLTKQIEQVQVEITPEQLLNFMKEGATINGNYVLNYTNDLSNDIKNKYRQETLKLWKAIVSYLDEQTMLDEETTDQTSGQIAEVIEEQAVLTKELTAKTQQLEAVLQASHCESTLHQDITRLIADRNHCIEIEVPNAITEEKTSNIVVEETASQEVDTTHTPVEEVITSIEKVMATLETIDGFDAFVKDLHEKKSRLENRALTIALFGAFSAGKSSFSNALFGKQVLPVSPNPTTAVINRINPVNATHPHGTVVIKLKADALLVQDVKNITKDFSPTFDHFSGLVSWIRSEKIYENPSLNKTYQSYLRAILRGYESRKDELGQEIQISLSDFAAFVTDESKACYIETVDLYYDSPLTRKGITLVDTPGADSVNARHTNVSFDYIKEADAIIYVTYYNHAITSADRDFLMQLGRVKEAFELDKMFFIVNASDLAENEADLNLVLKYVEEQLLQFGIRQPKIYPVSSKKSLIEKTNKLPLNEEMHHFEENFYTFIEEDLASLTIQSAIWDMNRAKTTLDHFIQSAHLTADERKAQVIRLNEKRQSYKNIVLHTQYDILQKRIADRIDRQLYYVMERLYIRFHDMFAAHFNPTTVTLSGRQAMGQLEQNRNRLLDYAGYELLQEVRAVSLRIEALMNELLTNTVTEIQQEMNQIDSAFMLPSMDPIQFTAPSYPQAFETIDKTIFIKALKSFKNLRTFFEKNQKEKMKEMLYESLKPEAAKYIDAQKDLMTNAYLSQWTDRFEQMKSRIDQAIDMVIDQNIKVLTEPIDLEKLKEKYDAIEHDMHQLY